MTDERRKALKEVFQSHWCLNESNELFDKIDRLQAEKQKIEEIVGDLKEWVLETGFSSNPETYVRNHLQTIELVLTLAKTIGIQKGLQP